jgi:UDPglucose 6-dehydrogenase
MRVCVQGLWHLGSVTAACLASVGHEVIGLDADDNTITNLSNSHAPLFEPGLDDLLSAGIAHSKLRFTVDAREALVGGQVLWVAFDTPVNEDDQADIDFVKNQIKAVLPYLEDSAIVLISSQMPVGSVRELEVFTQEHYSNKKIGFAYSPENLRLGKALDVFLKPDRIVVGFRLEAHRIILQELLSPITDKIEWMSVESAEMTKHAINAFLATSVTFANEIASICELVGADAKEVERGLKSEMRIGPKAYVSPGGAFAGGTLARDIAFLQIESDKHKLITPLLYSVRLSNDEHKKWVRRKLQDKFTHLDGITIAIWGLTYKAGTDTLRRSLSVELCDWLIEQNAHLQIYDPAVKNLPEHWEGKVKHCLQALDAINGAQGLVVGTEWPEFKEVASNLPQQTQTDLAIIDANRHLNIHADIFHQAGFTYFAVGTPVNRLSS